MFGSGMKIRLQVVNIESKNNNNNYNKCINTKWKGTLMHRMMDVVGNNQYNAQKWGFKATVISKRSSAQGFFV